MISARALLSFLILAIAFAAPAVLAQQASPEPTQLALEVYFYPKEPPTYQTVPAARRAAPGTRGSDGCAVGCSPRIHQR